MKVNLKLVIKPGLTCDEYDLDTFRGFFNNVSIAHLMIPETYHDTEAVYHDVDYDHLSEIYKECTHSGLKISLIILEFFK